MLQRLWNGNLLRMKIIFLDFDGVINPISFTAHGSKFSNAACANLNDLMTKVPDAKIVVSSSWRRWGLEKVSEILEENGIDRKKVIGITDSEGGWEPHQDREGQISRWLKAHSNVEKFVVLDDFPMPNLSNNALKLNGYIGLTQKDVEMASRILNGESQTEEK